MKLIHSLAHSYCTGFGCLITQKMLALFIIFYRIVTCRIFIDAFCCCFSVSFSIMFHDRNVKFYEFLDVYSKWIIDWLKFESCNRKLKIYYNIILNSRPNRSHVTLLSTMDVLYKWREIERDRNGKSFSIAVQTLIALIVHGWILFL